MDRNDALFWCLRLFIQTKIMGIIAGGLIRSYPTALCDRFLRSNEYPSNYIILNKSNRAKFFTMQDEPDSDSIQWQKIVNTLLSSTE